MFPHLERAPFLMGKCKSLFPAKRAAVFAGQTHQRRSDLGDYSLSVALLSHSALFHRSEKIETADSSHNLMTRRVILEGTASEHLTQKLTTMDDLLGVLIILERVFRCCQVGRSHGISGINKAFGPGLHIVEFVLQQLDPAVIVVS